MVNLSLKAEKSFSKLFLEHNSEFRSVRLSIHFRRHEASCEVQVDSHIFFFQKKEKSPNLKPPLKCAATESSCNKNCRETEKVERGALRTSEAEMSAVLPGTR